MLTVGQSSAIVVTHTRRDDHGYDLAIDWRTVSIAHILEFSDIEDRQVPPKRKRA